MLHSLMNDAFLLVIHHAQRHSCFLADIEQCGVSVAVYAGMALLC